ncbi:MAG: hypothetical protein JWO90_321, partial [Solirubrobacterales bacterium]|nr:hypothetical protein [Solirubrobacterales bacterium]
MAGPTATFELLYAALGAGDGELVPACHAPGASFEDPASAASRAEVGAIRRMLAPPAHRCGRPAPEPALALRRPRHAPAHPQRY